MQWFQKRDKTDTKKNPIMLLVAVTNSICRCFSMNACGLQLVHFNNDLIYLMNNLSVIVDSLK